MKTTLLCLFVVLCFGFSTVNAQASAYCPLCQFAVQYIDGYLAMNYTQTQIIKQLEIVCILAPDSFRPLCDTFVELYVPLLIDYIIREEDPENACTQLRFCNFTSSAKEASAFLSALDAQRYSRSSASCSFCQLMGASIAIDIAYYKMTESQVLAVETGLCARSPAPAQCLQWVREQVSALYRYITKGGHDYAAMCAQLHACP